MIPPTGWLIMYDRESKDFVLYRDGRVVGHARSYLEAERVRREIEEREHETE